MCFKIEKFTEVYDKYLQDNSEYLELFEYFYELNLDLIRSYNRKILEDIKLACQFLHIENLKNNELQLLELASKYFFEVENHQSYLDDIKLYSKIKFLIPVNGLKDEDIKNIYSGTLLFAMVKNYPGLYNLAGIRYQASKVIKNYHELVMLFHVEKIN